MKLKTLMMTAAVPVLIATGALAQDSTTATTTDGTAMGAETTDMTAGTVAPAEFTSINEMTVGDLIGQSVYGPDGDKIGDVDYVISQNNTASAVIGIGGFLGLGEYTVALPLSDFAYDSSQQMVTLDTTKDALKAQPEFDESTAESLPDDTPLADLMASSDMGGSTTMSDDAAKTESDDATMSGSDTSTTDATGDTMSGSDTSTTDAAGDTETDMDTTGDTDATEGTTTD